MVRQTLIPSLLAALLGAPSLLAQCDTCVDYLEGKCPCDGQGDLGDPAGCWAAVDVSTVPAAGSGFEVTFDLTTSQSPGKLVPVRCPAPGTGECAEVLLVRPGAASDAAFLAVDCALQDQACTTFSLNTNPAFQGRLAVLLLAPAEGTLRICETDPDCVAGDPQPSKVGAMEVCTVNKRQRIVSLGLDSFQRQDFAVCLFVDGQKVCRSDPAIGTLGHQ